MQRHPQGSEKSNQVRRRREEFTVAIRKQNRERIFSKKRFRSVLGYDGTLGVENLPITQEWQGRQQNYNPFGARSEEREREEWEREGEDHGEVEANIYPQEKQLTGQMEHLPYVPKVFSLSKRAEQLYGLKPYLPKTTLQPTSIRQNVALDSDLADFIQDVLNSPYALQSLDDAIDCLRQSEDELSLHRGAILIRRIVAHFGQVQGFQWIVVKLVDEGVLPILAGMVQQEKYIHLAMEAAWILSNIVAAEGYTKMVADMLNMQILLKLLACRSEIQLVLSLCWLIGNITSEIGQQIKHQLLSLGAIRTFKNIAENTDQKELFDACCWNIVNFFRGVDAERYRKELAQGVEIICRSMGVGLVNEFFVDSVHSLRLLKTTHLTCMARSGIIAYLLSASKQESHLQQETCMCMAQLLNDFAQGDELMCQLMLDCGALDLSEMWLRSGDDFFIEEALRMLSNIAASNTSQCLRILDRTEVMHLSASMLRHKDENIRQQACILFINVEPYGAPTTVFNVYRNVNILQHAFFILQDHNPGEYEKQILMGSVLELIQHVLENGSKEANLINGQKVFVLQMREALSDRWGIDWELLLVTMADDPSELIRTRVDKTLGDFFPRQRGWPERERNNNESQQQRREEEDELL